MPEDRAGHELELGRQVILEAEPPIIGVVDAVYPEQADILVLSEDNKLLRYRRVPNERLVVFGPNPRILPNRA